MGAGKGGVEKKFEVIDVDDDSEDDEPKKKEQKQNNGNNAGQITPRHAGSTTDAPPRTAMETPISPLQLATKVLRFVKSMDEDADDVD